MSTYLLHGTRTQAMLEPRVKGLLKSVEHFSGLVQPSMSCATVSDQRADPMHAPALLQAENLSYVIDYPGLPIGTNGYLGGASRLTYPVRAIPSIYSIPSRYRISSDNPGRSVCANSYVLG